jgi:hypothetical protein
MEGDAIMCYIVLNTYDPDEYTLIENASDIKKTVRSMLIRNAADGEQEADIEIYKRIGHGYGNLDITIEMRDENDSETEQEQSEDDSDSQKCDVPVVARKVDSI